MRSIAQLPRTIAPELVEIGDLVSVEHSKTKGVTHFKRGRVARRVDQGNVRQYVTDEGGILFTWQPGKKGVTITLIERKLDATTRESLFEWEEARIG